MGRQDEAMSTPGGRISSGKRHSQQSQQSQLSQASETTGTTPLRQSCTTPSGGKATPNNSTTGTSSQKSLPNDSFAGTERSTPPVRRLTAYEKLTTELNNDARVLKEITLGKRIAFYRIRGELGSGNFSQVKMGIHALTKGKKMY